MPAEYAELRVWSWLQIFVQWKRQATEQRGQWLCSAASSTALLAAGLCTGNTGCTGCTGLLLAAALCTGCTGCTGRTGLLLLCILLHTCAPSSCCSLTLIIGCFAVVTQPFCSICAMTASADVPALLCPPHFHPSLLSPLSSSTTFVD
jgi:hypothetical protein